MCSPPAHPPQPRPADRRGAPPGSREIEAADLTRRLALTRKLILMNMLAFPAVGLYFISLKGLDPGLLMCMLAWLLYVPWLWVLHKGRHRLARVGIHISSNVVLSFLVLAAGIEAQIQQILLVSAIQPYALFSPRERRLLRVMVAVPVTLYLLLLTLHPDQPLLFHIPPELMPRARLVCGVVFVSLALARVSFLFESNARNEAALQRAHAGAVEASRIKSQFLANMSHEIRTPLNGVLGMTRLVLDSPLSADQRECLLTAQQSAEGLVQIVNDILDISKIEAGRMDLEQAPFLLRDSIAEALQAQAPRAHERGLELYARIEPDAPWEVTGDATRLRQIVLNLVGNALKFTERGEVRVHVRRAAADLGGPEALHISVEDTGIGIPADRLEHIFQAFTQADGSTTRRYGGTGLGLTICRELVWAMGGRLWVDSQVGQGSAFHFTVQLPATATRPPGPGPRTTRCVVCEPHAGARDALLLLLQTLGVPATAAETPAAALAALVRDPASALGLLSLPADTPAETWAEVRRATQAGARVARLARRPHATPGAGESVPLLLCPVSTDALLRMLAEPAQAAQPDAPADPKPPAGQPMLVLVAEDNPVNAKIALRYLRKLGHRAIHVENGALAVQRLQDRADPIDVVLMDMQMPELDGVSATRAYRLWERGAGAARTPIIALTANAMKSNEIECREAGMDSFLSKPFTLEQLAAILSAAQPAAPLVAVDREAYHQL